MTTKKQLIETLAKTQAKTEVKPESTIASTSCQRALTSEEDALRKGRKSLVTLSEPAESKSASSEKAKNKAGRNAINKIRYIEGTTPLKDGCWLSD